MFEWFGLRLGYDFMHYKHLIERKKQVFLVTEKISGLCQHYQRWIYCWPEGFIPWLINFQLFAHKLIKWLRGGCADWFSDIIMTWSYCLHRWYSMSWQKTSILINGHVLNCEPVPLKPIIRLQKGPLLSLWVISKKSLPPLMSQCYAW